MIRYKKKRKKKHQLDKVHILFINIITSNQLSVFNIYLLYMSYFLRHLLYDSYYTKD